MVTGGAGYIGSHTVVALQEAGHDVLVVDNLSNAPAGIPERVASITGKRPDFLKLDVCDPQALRRCFARYPGIGTVIHFAAFKSVGESWQRPLAYYHNNVTGLIHLLKEMERVACHRLVFSSSCTVYGQPDRLPVGEDAPLKRPLSPYGNTKKMCEEIIADHSSKSHLKAISLRYFNPVGAHPSARIGEQPQGIPNNLLPFITQTAIGKRDALKVFGHDYDTADGTGIRDYIHVTDLADAHLKAVLRLAEGMNASGCEVFNLGTGKGHSVMEVIRLFEEISGRPLPHKLVGRREGDIEKVWADPGRANRVLGWEACKGLRDMLSSAWAWELAMAGQPGKT